MLAANLIDDLPIPPVTFLFEDGMILTRERREKFGLPRKRKCRSRLQSFGIGTLSSRKKMTGSVSFGRPHFQKLGEFRRLGRNSTLCQPDREFRKASTPNVFGNIVKT